MQVHVDPRGDHFVVSLLDGRLVHGLGSFLWLRRRRARAIAERISAVDAARYTAKWDALANDDAEGVALVHTAFEGAMAGALGRSRRQIGAKSLGELFQQAVAYDGTLPLTVLPFDLAGEGGGQSPAAGGSSGSAWSVEFAVREAAPAVPLTEPARSFDAAFDSVGALSPRLSGGR